jgi:hypothetical protein
MGSLSNYLLTLLENCSEQQTGQDAVEWAIVTGRVKLTYDLQADLVTIMGEPGKPDTGKYGEIIEGYQKVCQEHGGALLELYEACGLIESRHRLVRPVSPAQQQRISEEVLST